MHKLRKHVWKMEYCTNVARMTPLHVAPTWTYGLQFLLKWAADDIDIDQRDAGSNTPLTVAIILSGSNCHEGNSNVLCQHCDCFKSTELLLQAGACIGKCFPHKFDCDSGSLRTKMLLLEHLKVRCLELQRVVLSEISLSIDVAAAQLLDARIPEFVELLDEYGITLPSALEREFRAWTPVYCRIRDTTMADYAYELGFRDINGYDQLGWSPIGSYYWNSQYIAWLLSKGARIDMPLFATPRASSKITAAHAILGDISPHWPETAPPSSYSTWTSGLIQILLALGAPLQISDGSVCKCTLSGCYPLTYLLRPILESQNRVSNFQRLPEILAASSIDFINTPWIQLHCIRALTFNELQMTHTCCRQDKSSRRLDHIRGLRENEKEEEWEEEEEDNDVVATFDFLMGRLEMAYREHTGTFEEFLNGAYQSIMSAVLDKQNSRVLTLEERRAAEEIGVVWEADEGDTHEDLEVPVPATKDSQYWLNKMDEIMPELPGWSPENGFGSGSYSWGS